MFGTTELLLILAIVVLIFGASKLPEIGSGMGKAIKNFKKASDEIDITPEKDKDKSGKDEAGKRVV
ncbi:MAG: twin-arginine translocase TatA/TatE family subunit [Thermodesulfobacteriota bacterium]